MLQQPFSQGNLKSVLQESWGLLVFVSSSHYEKNWKVFVHKLSVVKEIINLNKDQITGNSSISNRYGTCQTIQAFQEFVDLGWQWKRNARQTLPWACHRHPMEKRLCPIIWVLSWAWQNYSAYCLKVSQLPQNSTIDPLSWEWRQLSQVSRCSKLVLNFLKWGNKGVSWISLKHW